MSDSEGLAFHYALTEANQHLFLPLQPLGTSGLARRLNAKAVHYVACRWDYSVTPKEMLAGPQMALVTNTKTGMAQTAFPADWGPNDQTGRAADLTPALMRDLGLETDDDVEVSTRGARRTRHEEAIASSSPRAASSACCCRW